MGDVSFCDHCGCVRIAQQTQGEIQVGPEGAVHLTFGRATLHFDTVDEFEAAAEATLLEWQRLAEDVPRVVRYEPIVLTLSVPAAQEFASLVRQARAELAWARGESPFTEEEFNRLVKRTQADS